MTRAGREVGGDVWRRPMLPSASSCLASTARHRSSAATAIGFGLKLLVVRPHALDENPTRLLVDTVHETVLDVDPPRKETVKLTD